jgi:hypothetical protein
MQKWVTELNTNEQRVNMRERSASGNSWVNILLGIWMVVSPFVLGFDSSKAIWNNVVTGALVGILAIVRWSIHQQGWSWLNLILGIWLVVSPFVLFLSGAAMWNKRHSGNCCCRLCADQHVFQSIRRDVEWLSQVRTSRRPDPPGDQRCVQVSG